MDAWNSAYTNAHTKPDCIRMHFDSSGKIVTYIVDIVSVVYSLKKPLKSVLSLSLSLIVSQFPCFPFHLVRSVVVLFLFSFFFVVKAELVVVCFQLSFISYGHTVLG